MDFLESAAILIPVLTGVEVTIYKGESDVLEDFERQYCFWPQIQGIYRASELEIFLKRCAEDLIYDLAEPLGSRLMVFKAGERWVLLGPYVEEGWSEPAARVLLTKLGASESVVIPYQTYRCKLPLSERDYVSKAALLVAAQSGDGAVPRRVKSIQLEGGKREQGQTFPDAYHDISIINRRYAMEKRFITAVSRGETEKALEFIQGFKTVSSDLRFMSSDLNDQLAGAAIVRTLIRMGAIQAGLNAVRIDAISQEHAQRMKHTASVAELIRLERLMVERICAEVRALHETRYSPCVRRAVDYMDINLSQPLTVTEIARAAEVDRHLLTRKFGQETGMTVKQYLAKRRCEIAAELLQDSRISVQEAAAYVGYSDNNYFSKVFKDNQGISPQSFQRMRWAPGIPLK